MPVILQIDAPGSYMDLRFRDVPLPKLERDEVLYKVLAFGLNYGELYYIADTYIKPTVYPTRTGQEAAGIVEAVGPDVTRFKVGDRVSSIPQISGAYCVNGEFAVSREQFLARWPEGFTAEEACSVWSAAITSYYPLVELAHVRPGDTVLVTAGSSSSGIGAIQMAKFLGAQVIATSRTMDKAPFLKDLGADLVIATDEADVSAETMRFTQGEGVRIVFDTIAGDFAGRYADGLAQGALVYLVGTLGGRFDISCPIKPLIRKGASLTGITTFNYHDNLGQFERAKNFILKAFDRRKLNPVIDRVFDYSDSIEAYGYMKSGTQTGKVIVRI
jgi:NADPH:quinone reductase-like Zn-dependent oxidoreductase